MASQVTHTNLWLCINKMGGDSKIGCAWVWIGSVKRTICIVVLATLSATAMAQQIYWAKVFPLPLTNKLICIAQDKDGFLYAGGSQAKTGFPPNVNYQFDRAYIIKLTEVGDTIFIKDLNITDGVVYSIAVDPLGNIRANVRQEYGIATGYHTQLITMTSEGFIIRRDTMPQLTVPYHCLIGKDSSLIITGKIIHNQPTLHSNMFFQRLTKEGFLDPFIELNPGHPDCGANRVEQLPNGHYLVSGYVGSRIASYELDRFGTNPVFKQWYQTPDFSNMTSGYVSRINDQRYMIGGQGNPSRVGNVDSSNIIYWFRSDDGVQVPPQAMTDGSTVFGYQTGPPSYQTMFRLGPDSSAVWDMALKDSLVVRGMNGFVQIRAFTYFEDQSAVLAGSYYLNGTTSYDPFFMKVANVGTPVTSLLKPKRGPLANETLAPWPNPTGGTLYLKQHFDMAEIHLHNLSGKEMGEYKIRFGQPVEISGYPAGVYLYRAVIDGKLYSGKILKR